MGVNIIIQVGLLVLYSSVEVGRACHVCSIGVVVYLV